MPTRPVVVVTITHMCALTDSVTRKERGRERKERKRERDRERERKRQMLLSQFMWSLA